jgi:hypothetical protein
MFFTTTDPRMMLQRRLDADAKRSGCCRPRSDEEASQASHCCAETEEATVVQRPLLGKRQPKDGSGNNALRNRPAPDA